MAVEELRQQLADLEAERDQPQRDYEQRRQTLEAEIAEAECQAGLDAFDAARAELVMRARQHAALCAQLDRVLKDALALVAEERRQLDAINDQAAALNAESVRLKLFTAPVPVVRCDWRLEFMQGVDRAVRSARW
jgi:hypothetical protein